MVRSHDPSYAYILLTPMFLQGTKEFPVENEYSQVRDALL